MLIACTEVTPPPTVAPSFRNQDAQIASQTNITAARMSGDWVVRQRYDGFLDLFDTMTITQLPNNALQIAVMIGSCIESDCSVGERLVMLAQTGPGRWTPVDPPAFWPDNEVWVMWMDFDSRTAAIGTPSGEFGWIMDRNATGGRDRIAAARDIMDWFGYDLSLLR